MSNFEDEGNEFQKTEEIIQNHIVTQNPNSFSSLPVLIYCDLSDLSVFPFCMAARKLRGQFSNCVSYGKPIKILTGRQLTFIIIIF